MHYQHALVMNSVYLFIEYYERSSTCSYCYIGQVRRHHPEVVLSVKTHQASRSVLNYQKEIVNKLHNLGLIEQLDQEKLLEVHFTYT